MANRLVKEYRELCAARDIRLAEYAKRNTNKDEAKNEKIPLIDGDPGEIILTPLDPTNLYEWRAFILGPPDTPFAGGRFELRVSVPRTYPHAPPKVKFVTRCCHPNVHFKTGEICLDVLKDSWTPIWTLESTCRAIIALLANPEASSPLNCDCGNLIRAGDMRGYWSLARMYTLEHAMQYSQSTEKNSN